jgi:hypothetical protein
LTGGTLGVDYTIDAQTAWGYFGGVRDAWFQLSITVTAINAFSSKISIRSGNDDERRVNGKLWIDDIQVIPENSGIIEARSQVMKLIDCNDCTTLIKHGNETAAFGQPVAYETYWRVLGQLTTDFREEQIEQFRFSTGETQNVYTDIQTGRNFKTGWMPKYVHDILQCALGSDTFVIKNEVTGDEVGYSRKGKYEEDRQDRFILFAGSVDLLLTEQIVRNSLCELGSCESPTEIYASGINATQLVVNWTDITGVTGYEVRYREYGDTNWTTVTTAVNSKTLTGLTTAKVYEIQVRTECDTDVFSMWSISYLVKTD